MFFDERRDPLDGPGVERVREPGALERFKIAVLAAHSAEREIVAPGVAARDLLAVEGEGVESRHRVVDIIEGIEEDMLFLHPEAAALEERVAVVVTPRHILPFDLAPERPAVGGGGGGI